MDATPDAKGNASGPLGPADYMWIVVCVVLGLLLLLIGGFALAPVLGSDEIFDRKWTAWAALVGGVGIAVLVARTRPRALPWLGVVAGLLAFVAAYRLGSWDLEGNYDKMVETTEGKLVLVAVGVGGLWSLTLGLGAVFTARRWGGRAGGLLVALFGTFWLVASAF